MASGTATGPVVTIDIDSLVLEGSPRTEGEDSAHVRMLAEVESALPPILVHRPTARVLDGVHRVLAAKMVGRETIEAELFDGDGDVAFVKAVEANVTHGLPLSPTDRRLAAAQIIAVFPAWSDRAVASSSGLSPGTVRVIRSELVDPEAEPSARVGRDGKLRPVNAAEGRERAAAIIADRPEASLREIARSAGISLGTARDVRQRVARGENPLPSRMCLNGTGSSRRNVVVPSPEADAARMLRKAVADPDRGTPATLLDRLRLDPSLRYTDAGRSLLHWLSSRLRDPMDLAHIAQDVPPHCMYTIAELAISYASAWEDLAGEMLLRAQNTTGTPS